MNRQTFVTKLAAALSLAFLLSGCYTQLYTQGYYDRGQYYGYTEKARPGDSARAAAQGSQTDTLVPGDSLAPKSTVIVNNYYQEPVYRGYAYSDWDYPIVSLGFYSTRYQSYSDPYWWSDPGYRARYYYDGGYHSSYRGYTPYYPPNRGNPNYRSDKRIFSPAPDYPHAHKGRRYGPSAPNTYVAPAPKVSGDGSAPPPQEKSSDQPAKSEAKDSGNQSSPAPAHKGHRR